MKSSNLSAKREGQLRPMMMPADVRAGQVIGLVEVTGGLGSPIDISRLADELGGDLSTLLPMLDAAEMLGLIRTERGDVFLTELGLKFQKTVKNKLLLVRETLSKVEPFRTALELTARKTRITSHDVAEALWQKEIRWHHERELNEALVHSLLIHWSIYGALLSYNGKTGKFHKA